MARWLLCGIVLLLANSAIAGEIINPYRFDSVATGLIGTSTHGAFANIVITDGANKCGWALYPTITPGVVRSVTTYVTLSGHTAKYYNVGIYSADGATKHAEGNLTVSSGTTGYFKVPLDTPFTLVDGTSYRLAFGTSDDPAGLSVGFTTANGSEFHTKVAETIGDAMPDTMQGTGTTTSNYKMDIYADGTP